MVFTGGKTLLYGQTSSSVMTKDFGEMGGMGTLETKRPGILVGKFECNP